MPFPGSVAGWLAWHGVRTVAEAESPAGRLGVVNSTANTLVAA